MRAYHAIGAAFLLPPLGVPNAGAYLFVALGVAFAAAWAPMTLPPPGRVRPAARSRRVRR